MIALYVLTSSPLGNSPLAGCAALRRLERRGLENGRM